MRSVAFRVPGLVTAGIFSACVLSGGAAANTDTAEQGAPQSQAVYRGSAIAVGAPDTSFDIFLNHLMRAESNGRSHAKNPRSSALGPFQFINSTFLAVMRKHFPQAVANMSDRQILALRTSHEHARRAAEAFTRENLDYLAERGLTPTFGHLRLAFLLGPQGAARVLEAPPHKPVTAILESAVISANPFMRRMRAADLIARATRDAGGDAPVEAPADLQVAAKEPAAEKAPAATDAIVVAQADVTQTDAAPAQVVQDAAPQDAEHQTVAAPPAEVATAPKTEAAAEVSVEVAAVPPAQQPAVADADTVADADPKADDRATPAARTERPLGRVVRSGGQLVINVNCDDRQASCRRWIDQQVAKLIKVSG